MRFPFVTHRTRRSAFGVVGALCLLASSSLTPGCYGSHHRRAGFEEEADAIARTERLGATALITSGVLGGYLLGQALAGLGGGDTIEPHEASAVGVAALLLAGTGISTIVTCERKDRSNEDVLAWEAEQRTLAAAERVTWKESSRAKDPVLWDSIRRREKITWGVVAASFALNGIALSDGPDSDLALALGPPSAIGVYVGLAVLAHNGMRERRAFGSLAVTDFLLMPNGLAFVRRF